MRKIPIDYDRRSARNPISGRSVKVDGNMTYKDWVESLSAEERQALELARKKDSRAVKNYVDKSAGSGIIDKNDKNREVLLSKIKNGEITT